MRVVFTVFLLSFIALRTCEWKAARERAMDFCAHFHVGNSLTTLTGEVVSSLDPFRASRFKDPGLHAEIRLPLEAAVPDFGQRVRLSARFKCFPLLKNPGNQADPLLQFEPIRLRALARDLRYEILEEPSGLITRGASWGARAITGHTENLPGLRALLLSIWTGESSMLPHSLKELYRDGGLLQLLALSGQHALAAAMLLRALLDFLFQALPFTACRRLFPHLRQALPLVSAAILWVLSRGMPSMARTLAMALALVLLRGRAFSVRTAHVLSIALGFLLLADPTQLGSRGLILSGAATYFCLRQLEGMYRPRPLLHYLWVSTTMPILLWPFQVWYFCRLSLCACLYTVLQAWLWDFVILPLGFALPFLLRVPVLGPKCGALAEMGFWKFVAWNQSLSAWLPPYSPVVVRLHCWEVVALVVILVSLLRAVEKRAFQMRGYRTKIELT